MSGEKEESLIVGIEDTEMCSRKAPMLKQLRKCNIPLKTSHTQNVSLYKILFNKQGQDQIAIVFEEFIWNTFS